MKSSIKTKAFAAFAASTALLLIASPVFADTSMSVSNSNQANVSNSISVSTNTGGNTSTGGTGAAGGSGGGAVTSGSGTLSSTAGIGGDGGWGGVGGNITTGSASASLTLGNDVNTTHTSITDSTCACDQYNTALNTTSNRALLRLMPIRQAPACRATHKHPMATTQQT